MLVASLSFNGNAEEAFNFYKDAFGGTFKSLNRFSEMPGIEKMSEADKNKIMHVMLEAPHGVKLIGNDYMDFEGAPFLAGNNFSLTLLPDTRELADRLFNALSAGGTVTMPIGEVFWGAYFGMFNDKFGIRWMINQEGK